MDALQAHAAMSQRALGSKQLMSDLKSVLLGTCKLWESLRAKAGQDLSA
jgi:hypothetical protein